MWVHECGVFFGVVFFAAIMQDGGGEDDIAVECAGCDVLHVAEVAGEAYYGAGVADEAALAQADGRVILAGGGSGHCPEAGRASIERGADKRADILIGNEGDFCI